MPGSYEQDLISMQLDRGVGIFACDSYTVLSSTSFTLTSHGPVPGHVNLESIGSLWCPYGGPYHLALNSEVFVRAWQRIFQDGAFRDAAWTVKADPDAVFLVSRLRGHLAGVKAPEGAAEWRGSYLNNCDEGLHGPLEVLSRRAMETLAAGLPRCQETLRGQFNTWGEDVFLRDCLHLLQVDRVDDFRLLSDRACFHEDPTADGCSSGKVAFHPFKTAWAYQMCLSKLEGVEKL